LMMFGINIDTWALILSFIVMGVGGIATVVRHAIKVEKGLTRVEGAVGGIAKSNDADHEALKAGVRDHSERIGKVEVQVGKVETKVDTICRSPSRVNGADKV